MFSSKVRGSKDFAAEQKIREFKKLLFQTKALDKRLKKRIIPKKFIQKATNHLKNIKSVKYGFTPEQMEQKSTNSREFKGEYDFHRLQKVKLDADRRFKSDIKKVIRFKRTLIEPQEIVELVYVLAERLKKKDALGRLYKSTTENMPFLISNNCLL